MLIFHTLKDLSFELFPDLKKYADNIAINSESIKEAFIDYYTYGPFRPKINIENDLVTIEIDIGSIEKYDYEFQKAVKLAEKGKLSDAKILFKQLIDKNPSISEFHRNYGQILETEGKYEEAKNVLIDALRWDPRNKFALIMMGNIYAKYLNDFETAKKFYNETLSIDPNDYIALTSIGAVFANYGKNAEAEQYFNLSYSIKADYPNTLYGLGLINKVKRNYLSAFDYAIKALKLSDVSTNLNKVSGSLLIDIARLYSEENKDKIIYQKYLDEISILLRNEIKIEVDNTISLPAKTEVAEKHKREYHLIKHKSDIPAINHFILHELVHLDLIAKARLAGNYKDFTYTEDSKKLFDKDAGQQVAKLKQLGFLDKDTDEYLNMLYRGLLSQLFNNPIDLIVEDFIFSNYPENRPIQLLGLLYIQEIAIEGANKEDMKNLIPVFVRESNIVMNLVHVNQIKEFFGIDISKRYLDGLQFQAQANKLYNNFKYKQKSLKPGDEYDLVNFFGKELKLTKYFKFNQESRKTDTEDILSKISKDPLNIESESRPEKESRISFEPGSANSMAVTMYCLSAIQYFEDKDKSIIRKITFEIAMLGSYGLDPNDNQKHISLKTIPDKKFTPLQLLAYEYVGFQIIDPTVDTGLDFQNEYELAKGMNK